jgi:acyl carrier protein phosphodiesterase
MISDFVKGKKQFDFEDRIRKGIVLHRWIDQFTDSHAATAKAKTFFKPHYRLYSGALVDVIYDHYLANDPVAFPGESLQSFSGKTYRQLENFSMIFPERFATLFPYMKAQDWLFHYREEQGIEKSLHGVVRRSKWLTESQTAFDLFQLHYHQLGDLFQVFWKDCLPQAKMEFERLMAE